ncbi:MAG: hypothetical protein HQ500_02410 [Flavobacteriales bacterium]|nr:hypothetical protein [Flavobacteriales bacterium]
MTRIDYYWVGFSALVVAIIAFQIPYLNLGHFWDEAWVYAPAIRDMSFYGPSILPDAIDLSLGRGHPLLFQALGGVWAQVFGISNVSLHSYALFISLSLLIVVFVGVRRQFGPGAALLASFLIGSQAMFLAQSAMLYPEMFMGLGLIIAVLGYIDERKWQYLIGMILAIYAKESALVFLFAFTLWDVLRLILIKDRKWRDLWVNGILVLVFLSHPTLTYLYHGWFFNPEHTGYILDDPLEFKFKLRMVFRTYFEDTGRLYLFYPALAATAFFIGLKKKYWNVLLLFIGFAAYKILEWKWVVKEPYTFFTLMLVFAMLPYVFWYILKKKASSRYLSKNQNLFGLGYLIILGFILFSALNFFTPRYLLATVILGLFLVSIAVWNVFKVDVKLKLVISVALVVWTVYSTATIRTVSEVNVGLYDDLRIQQSMVDWLIENEARETTFCASFVTTWYLSNYRSGYIPKGSEFLQGHGVNCSDSCDSELLILTNTGIECHTQFFDSLLQSSLYETVFDSSMRQSRAVVFKRMNN